MKVRTSSLTGKQLDWAVSKCEGRREPEVVNNFAVAWYTWGNTHYSTKPEIGYRIIERERLEVTPWGVDGEWRARDFYEPSPGVPCAEQYGPTPLIAAMRCYVTSKLGDEIEIPDELGAPT